MENLYIAIPSIYVTSYMLMTFCRLVFDQQFMFRSCIIYKNVVYKHSLRVRTMSGLSQLSDTI